MWKVTEEKGADRRERYVFVENEETGDYLRVACRNGGLKDERKLAKRVAEALNDAEEAKQQRFLDMMEMGHVQ